MKVTVTPDGWIEFDIPENALSPNTVALIQAIRNGKVPQGQKPVVVEPKTDTSEPRKRGVSKLSPELSETRNVLAATSNAVTSAALAAELGINGPAANWRLRQLVDKGFAYRLGRGRYKLVPKRG